jgi:hypothetical protein
MLLKKYKKLPIGDLYIDKIQMLTADKCNSLHILQNHAPYKINLN